MDVHLIILCVLCCSSNQQVIYAQESLSALESLDYSSDANNDSFSYNMAEPQINVPDIKIALFNPEVALDDIIQVTLVNTSFENADYAFIIHNTRRSNCGNVIRIYDSKCSFALMNLEWYIRFYIRSHSTELVTPDNVRLGQLDNSSSELKTWTYHDNCSDWSMKGNCDEIDVYDGYMICFPAFGEYIPDWSPYYTPHFVAFDCTFNCATDCKCTLDNSGLTSVCINGTSSTAIVWNHPTQQNRISFRGNIEGIRENAFSTNNFIEGITSMDISSNRILRYLEKGAFNGFLNLTELNLSYNILQELENGTFNSLMNLVRLNLEWNQLKIRDACVFSNLIHLRELNLGHNHISNLPSGLFVGLVDMIWFTLRYNDIIRLQPGVFLGMDQLEFLDLSHNGINVLESNVLVGLHNLKTLNLGWNGLQSLSDSAFMRGLSFTDRSNIRYTTCDGIELGPSLYPKTCAARVDSLTTDVLTSGNTMQCPLQLVTLSGNNVTDFSFGSLKGLSNASVEVDHDWLCCFLQDSDCVVLTRERTTNNFLTCNRLLPNSVSMILLWIFGCLAVLGNLHVIFWQIYSKGYKKVQSLLIANLAVSDLLMGIYMVIIASADVHYGDYFPAKTEVWRNSTTCLVAGTLAMISSEASILLVTLISIDRLMGIRFTFSRWRVRIKSASVLIIGLWLVALILSLIPALVNVSALNYELSEVCVALPLSRKEIYTVVSAASVGSAITYTYGISHSGMYYSIAIFIGLNSLCCFVIAVSYIWIFITVKLTARHAGRQREAQEEVRMAMKMSLIVLTDFCTWVPVIIMGILVQTGVQEINPVASAWIVTLLMPINSAINPFMYTLSTVILDRLKKTKRNWCSRRGEASRNTKDISISQL